MAQVGAAVVAIQKDDAIRDVHLERALETALVVCYARAFTRSNFMDAPPEYVPSEDDEWLHNMLMEYRHWIYAHTDKKGGRAASVDFVGGEAAFSETYRPIPEQYFPDILDLAGRLSAEYHDEAERLARELELEGKGSGTE
jgi:hypothetical protein